MHRRLSRTLLTALFLAVLPPCRLAAWQCPDGAPPPCAGTRRVAARPAPPTPDVRARRFLLLPFRNVSRAEAQEWLVTGAPIMLADGLGQLRELTVIPDVQLAAARRRLGIAPAAEPDAAQLRRLAEETGGWTAVTGNIVATGGRLRLTAQALDAVDGRVLARATADVPADADVRAAFDRLGAQLLAASGLPAAGITDLASLTTGSLDAYRAYLRGLELLDQSAYRRATLSFREAVRLDSTFALGWSRLALTVGAWNVQAMFDPRSEAYTAAERAMTLAQRLPPRQERLLRAMHGVMHGQFTRSQRLIDSLIATDAEDLDARELGAMCHLLNPMIDTTSGTPRMMGSLNRSIALAREVLEKDPGRRHIYSVLAYAYGASGGLWFGGFPGTRREIPTYAALAFTQTEDFIPALRDSFVMMPAADFHALPPGEQRALRRRATDAGAAWVQRWLTAAPGEAEAHVWASRFLELQDSLPQALREATIADSLGVESGLESITGRRLRLLVRNGRYADAGVLADSLAVAGVVQQRPFVPAIENTRAFGLAALLLSGRLTRASELAQRAAAATPARPACRAAFDLSINTVGGPDEVVAIAVADSVAAHAAEFVADPLLAPCLWASQALVGGPPRAAAGARLLAIAGSLAAAGQTDLAVIAARSAWRADSSLGARLAALPWLAEAHRRFEPARRMRAAPVIVDADSVTYRWELDGAEPLRWDYPTLPLDWGFGVTIRTGDGPDAQAYFAELVHSWRDRPAPAEGGVPELVEAAERSVRARYRSAETEGLRPSRAVTATSLHVTVRGGLADALRRSRPASAVAWSAPCPPGEPSQCRTTVPIIYRN